MAKGLPETVGCSAFWEDVSEAPTEGTGPGMDGGVENSGRASSRKENVGIAEESTTPNTPGAAGAGG
jgi:hypothetical protein